MNSQEIALQLRALDLIPESVEHDILHSSSRGKANAHLLVYLKRDATVKTVQEIFKFATEEASYEKMNAFATNMLRKLQGGLYYCVHYTDAMATSTYLCCMSLIVRLG